MAEGAEADSDVVIQDLVDCPVVLSPAHERARPECLFDRTAVRGEVLGDNGPVLPFGSGRARVADLHADRVDEALVFREVRVGLAAHREVGHEEAGIGGVGPHAEGFVHSSALCRGDRPCLVDPGLNDTDEVVHRVGLECGAVHCALLGVVRVLPHDALEHGGVSPVEGDGNGARVDDARHVRVWCAVHVGDDFDTAVEYALA